VTSCIVDSAAIYIMVVKFRNTICPPPPQLSFHRRAALSSDSNGTRSYIAERTQSAVYIVRCLWVTSIYPIAGLYGTLLGLACPVSQLTKGLRTCSLYLTLSLGYINSLTCYNRVTSIYPIAGLYGTLLGLRAQQVN
jgi:hypothetical protein